MFKWRSSEQRGPAQHAGGPVESCPKCGAAEVLGDYCQRCRVQISTYQAYIKSLGKSLSSGAQRAAAKRRRWFVFKGPDAPSVNWRPAYEDAIQRKIYRELEYPVTARGVYLVLLAFDLNAAGRPEELQLSVTPHNPDVARSVRTALDRAQPFPLPSVGLRGGRTPHITLALTVSV